MHLLWFDLNFEFPSLNGAMSDRDGWSNGFPQELYPKEIIKLPLPVILFQN